MKKQLNIHGIISIILILDATGVAIYSIGQTSLLVAIIYSLLFFVFIIIVSIIYCRKCLCRENCNHLFIGWISKKLVKPKKSDYTANDILFGVIIPILPVILIPQFFLIDKFTHFILFWLFYAIAGLEINKFVCRGCKNTKCLMCSAQNR